VTAWAGGPGDLDDRQRAGIRRALAKWRQHRELLEAQAHDPGMPLVDGEDAGVLPAFAPSPPFALTPPDPAPPDPAPPDPAGHPAPNAAPRPAASHPGVPHPAPAPDDRTSGLDIELVDVELLHPGRPGVLDVVAEMDGRLAHAVFGLRRPGDELHVVGPVEDPALGFFEDADGMAVLVDALHDADATRLLLHAVAGSGIDRPPEPSGSTRQHPGEVVSLVSDSADATVLGIDRRFSLSVFPWLRRGRHPGVTVLAGLDEAGFNHVAAPVALWRRSGRDLGAVQEFLTGASGGWALALASLRDLFADGGPPDAAGGDFSSEALALGTMTARMHLALDRAFGRRPGDPAAWASEVEQRVEGSGLHPALEVLRRAEVRPPTIRVHGDFHLGRTARTDHGWVLVDTMPGGTEGGSDEPVFRSPLVDVAGFCASLRRAARAAARERGPGAGSPELGELASAWEERNRQAFLAAYLATPGVGGLVPANRELLHHLLTCFELLAAARRPSPVDVSS
jgi:maltokinase